MRAVHGHYRANEAVCQENETKRQKRIVSFSDIEHFALKIFVDENTHEISDTAKSCPNCGYELPTKTDIKRNAIIIGVSTVLLIGCIILFNYLDNYKLFVSNSKVNCLINRKTNKGGLT